MSSENRLGIWVETSGYLSKDRRLFYFGKRVETVGIKNSTAATVTVDVAVARDPVFYIPSGGNANNRTEITQPTYFYLVCPAGQTVFSPPFHAERGLVLRRVGGGTGVWGGACVYGVQPGECKTKGQIRP